MKFAEHVVWSSPMKNVPPFDTLCGTYHIAGTWNEHHMWLKEQEHVSLAIWNCAGAGHVAEGAGAGVQVAPHSWLVSDAANMRVVWAIASPDQDAMQSKWALASWLDAPPCTGWGPCDHEAAEWFCKLDPMLPAPPPTPPPKIPAPPPTPPPKPATPAPPPGPAPKRARRMPSQAPAFARLKSKPMPAQPKAQSKAKSEPVENAWTPTQPKAEPLWAAFDAWVNDCVEPRDEPCMHNNWEDQHATDDDPQPDSTETDVDSTLDEVQIMEQANAFEAAFNESMAQKTSNGKLRSGWFTRAQCLATAVMYETPDTATFLADKYMRRSGD